MDKAKMLELFGSDSEGSDDEPAPPSGGGGGDDAGEGVDEADLFGSDGDDDEDGGQAASAPQVPSAPPLHYELPALRRPPAGSELLMVRMPNILKVQPRPFESDNPECLEKELGDPFQVDGDGDPRYEVRGENVIRWRTNPDTGGRQSNAKMVRWSDGSTTLHVGNEVLSAPKQRLPGGGTHLYTRHKGSNLECHGTMEQRMLFQPVSIDSSTHRALTKHIAKSWEGKSSKGGRSIIMTATTEAPELEKQKREKQWEEKRRLDLRQSSHRRSVGEYSASGPTLSASFLEADEEEEGNLGAIKRRFKNQRSKARGGGSSGGGGGGRRKRPRLYRDDDEAEADESDDDDEERAWDAEERRAAATGEMDDFIAADDEEDGGESEEDSDEFGAMDDD